MDGKSPIAVSPPTYQPLVVVLAAVSIGIVADRYLEVNIGSWLALALPALAVWIFLWRAGRTSAATVSALIACAAIGGAWHHRQWYLFADDDLGHFATAEPQPVSIEAVVNSGPRRMPAPPPNPLRAITVGDRTRLDLQATAIRDGDIWKPASGNTTLVVNGHLIDVFAGDRVRVFGQLLLPNTAQNPGEFDYADYCRGNRVLCLMRGDSPQCVEVLTRSSRWLPQRAIDSLRAAGERALWQYISPRNAGLASAMFLGLRDELDREQMDAFIETGTVHLLVISGLNVGILAACVLLGLRTGWLSTRAALFTLAITTILYAIITDAQPPVVRATVLVLVFCFARLLGRRGMAFNSLAAAALIVLALNPIELFRPGTQLSFLAVAALIAIGQSKWLMRKESGVDALVMHSLPARMQLAYLMLNFVVELTLISLAVWLAVQPLVAAKFHMVTPAAIILGPLLALPVAIAMATGFGVMVFGWLLPPLAAICGYICDRALTVVVATVEAARNAPFSRFWTAGPSDWWLVGCYGMLALWVLLPAARQLKRRRIGTVAAGWIFIGLAASWMPGSTQPSLTATFLSVGHGCAVVLELPDGKTLLYDAGSMASPEFASRTVAGFLWSRGIARLDGIVISHADADHYNAVPRLLEQFSVDTIYISPQLFHVTVEGIAELHDAIAASGVTVREVSSGEMLRADDACLIQVLHPPASGVAGRDNANSIVLKVEHAGHFILLTGDLESPGLELVTSTPAGPIDVLLAPHHGSTRSDPPGFSRWASAKHVVISGSGHDQSPAVRGAYEASGATVYHTATDGAVTFRISSEDLAVETFCKPQLRPAEMRSN